MGEEGTRPVWLRLAGRATAGHGGGCARARLGRDGNHSMVCAREAPRRGRQAGDGRP